MNAAGPGTFRCASAARLRADPMMATAPPARRLLLIEVPGPWGRTALTDSRLDRYASGRLADAADSAGVRVQLIRRPGRHAAPLAGEPAPEKAWAVVDTTPGRVSVRWGRWRHEHDLLEVDLTASRTPPAADAPSGPPLALVCTHGRHDVCCALRGRPVAAALAEGTGWDVWECSHLGGDRFAANVLLLPSGELLGGLDEVSAVAAVRAVEGGRIPLEHYRGRLGRTSVEQAAIHLAMRELGETRRDALRVVAVERCHEAVHARAAAHLGVEPDGDGWTVDVQAPDGVHRVTLVTTWAAAAQLTCSAGGPARSMRFELLSVERRAVPTA